MLRDEGILFTQNKWIFEAASILLTMLIVKLAVQKQREVDLF